MILVFAPIMPLSIPSARKDRAGRIAYGGHGQITDI